MENVFAVGAEQAACRGLYRLITHDMGVVAEMADEVMVMYAGEIVEYGTLEQIFDHPGHPYTIGLLKSIPRLDRDTDEDLYTIEGIVPSLSEYSDGCRFANRCPYASEECARENVAMEAVQPGHIVRCRRLKDLEVMKNG